MVCFQELVRKTVSNSQFLFSDPFFDDFDDKEEDDNLDVDFQDYGKQNEVNYVS